MIFTVTWSEAAIQMLAHIWDTAANKNAVTVASDEIDRTLRVDPDTVGRRRYGPVREYRRRPLGVTFEVNVPDRIVQVISVWALP